jgi:hypothetical protein
MLWLCEKCVQLGQTPIEEVSNVQHHSSYAALVDAGQDGCQACVLFRTATIFTYALTFGTSLAEAEFYQQQIDTDDELRPETERRPFCTNLVGPVPSTDKISSIGLFGLLYTRPYSPSDGVHLTPTKAFITAYPAKGMLNRNQAFQK